MKPKPYKIAICLLIKYFPLCTKEEVGCVT